MNNYVPFLRPQKLSLKVSAGKKPISANYLKVNKAD